MSPSTGLDRNKGCYCPELQDICSEAALTNTRLLDACVLGTASATGFAGTDWPRLRLADGSPEAGAVGYRFLSRR